jgi:hypothetical protein
MADAFTRQAVQAIKGFNVVYTLYPVIGAGVSIGVVTTGGAANVFGADAELIAAAAITTEYWFCNAIVNTSDAAETFVVDIEIAGVTHVYAFRINPTAVTVNMGQYGPPFPVRIPANSQLTARQASPTGGKVLGVSVTVATGL